MQKVKRKQIDFGGTDIQYIKGDGELGNISDIFPDQSYIPSGDTIPDGTVIENIVQDYDGNWYDGVVMNNQIWLKQNLRVTHNPSGTSITYKHANGDSNNDEIYGLLYDWNTMMNGASSSDTVPSGVQGIAPDGWHIPSRTEWDNFLTYVGQQNQYVLDNNNHHISKAISSKEGWLVSTVNSSPGKNPEDNNLTNFSIYPAGNFFNTGRAIFGEHAVLWSSTESDNTFGSCYDVYRKNANVIFNGTSSSYAEKTSFNSVRCICNTSASNWFAANRSRLYLKLTSSGMVWKQLSEVAESGSYNDLLDKPEASQEVLICNYSNNTVDKTPQEIYEAYQAGMLAVCYYNNLTLYLVKCAYTNSTYLIRFYSIANANNQFPDLYYLSYNGTSWALSSKNLQNQLIGSGTGQNIKTVNGNNLLGSGDISITASGINAIPVSEKDSNNGVATLNSSGKIPSHQLPSYVDDVLEYGSFNNFPATGEHGKIYVTLDTNKTYRWSGSAYVEISESLALGETPSTAYRGDRGKTAYDHSQVTDGNNPHNTTFANIADKPTTISGYGITDAFSGSYNDLTDKPTNATQSSHGFMSASDKAKLNGIQSYATKGMYNILKPKGVEVRHDLVTYCYPSVTFSKDEYYDNLILYFEPTPGVDSGSTIEVQIDDAFSYLHGYDKHTILTYNDIVGKTFIVTWDLSNGMFYLYKEIITDVSTKYDTGDTAETTIADGDYFPFYDTSATAKRKSLWSNIKSVLTTYFNTLYQGVIDASHKLSADLIVDGTTNKVINVKPDWNAASGADAEILNKPTIPSITLITWTNS